MNRSIRRLLYSLLCTMLFVSIAHGQWPGVWYDGHRTRHAPGQGALSGQADGIPGVTLRDQVWTPTVRRASLTDLDADGHPELLVAAYGRIHAYDVDTGRLLWSSAALGANLVIGTGELKDGGAPEVVVSADTAGARVWILDSTTGALLSTHHHSPRNATIDHWHATMVNIDDDDALELVWRPGTTASGTLYLANFDVESGVFETRSAAYEGDWTSHQILAGDVDGDGRAEVLVNQIGELRVWHPDTGHYTVFPDIHPGHVNTEQYLFRLPDQDADWQVVTGNVHDVGIGVDAPTVEGGRVWACWLGSGSQQRPRLESATQRTPPMDIDGDGDPDLIMGLRGGGMSLDLAHGPCPAADTLMVDATWTAHIFDLRSGTLVARQANLEPMETLDLIPGGGAEVLGIEDRRDVLYTFADGGLSPLGALPGDVVRVMPSQRHPGAVNSEARAVIHRSAEGVGHLLLRVGGLYQFYDPVSAALWEAPADLIGCGSPTDVHLDPTGAATVAFSRGTTVCVYDAADGTVTRLERLPGEANERVMAQDLDGDGRSELVAFNQVYDIAPGAADAVTLRYATAGRIRFVAEGASPAGPLPMVIAISEAQVTAHGPDGQPIWIYDLDDARGRYRVSHVEVAPFFAHDGDDFAIVLDDRVDPNGRVVVMASYAEGDFAVSEPFFIERNGGALFTTDTYQALFLLPAELGQPGQWGAADGQMDLVIRGGRNVAFMDASTGDALAPAARLDFAETPVRLFSTVDVDGDQIDELVALPADVSQESGVAALFELGPSGLPEGYAEGTAMVPVWTTQLPAPMDSHSTYAVFANQGGAYRVAYINADGGLFVLDGPTGRVLNGYPIYLRDGALQPIRPRDSATMESMIAFDVNGDGAPELLVSGGDGWLYAIEVEHGGPPRMAWQIYLGAPVSQVIPAYLEGDDDVAELAVVMGDGRILGIGPAAAHIQMGAQAPEDFVGPELSLRGTALGADRVEAYVNGVRFGRVDVEAGEWTLDAFALPEGCSEVIVIGLLGDVEAARAARRYCTDWDHDGLANWLDCAAVDGHRDPLVRPDRLETCDAVDNDCDGVVDEALAPPPADLNDGLCGGLVKICAGADGWQAPDYEALDGFEVQESTCDGFDNDCDGHTDEETDGGEVECGVGVCAAVGRERCVDGALVTDCTPEQPLADEACNGRDDDCDGELDEEISERPMLCGIGLCQAPGRQVCEGGEFIDECTPFEPADELCDGLDNDCDALADEGLVSSPITCGLGICRAPGRLRCINGEQFEECNPGLPAEEVCNGLDDDCNGGVDDGLPVEVVRCGVGACEVRGQRRCMGGEYVVLCTPFDPREETCNGRDDDCDGLIDESVVGAPVRCGIGACAAEGRQVCLEGRWVNDCAPGAPLDEECDGDDNDCDGVTDEDIAPEPTTCGLGACAAEGIARCIEGAMLNACAAGPPGDEICDGVDNDCNGVVDDQIVPVPTRCGVGACATEGEQGCFDGEVLDTCRPLAAGVEVCDGIDNDCDGDTDEDASGEVTECGIGGCASIGTLVCVNGELVDTCRPRPASAEVCDALDNDCNGEVDDGLVVRESICGVGACESTGTWTCADGLSMDTCIPGDPAPEACDALDNDCDGAIDEGEICGTALDAAPIEPMADAGLETDGSAPPPPDSSAPSASAPDAAVPGASVPGRADGGCGCDLSPEEQSALPGLLFLLVVCGWRKRRRLDGHSRAGLGPRAAE